MKTIPADITIAVQAALGIIEPPHPLIVTPTRESIHFSSRVVSNVPGFDELRVKTVAPSLVQRFFPHRLLHALITENLMSKGSSQRIESHGVCALTLTRQGKARIKWFPELNHGSQFCIVYGFRKDLKSVAEILSGGVNALTDTEYALLRKSAQALHLHHSRKPPTKHRSEACDLYNMGLSHLMAFAGEFAIPKRRNIFLTHEKIEHLVLLTLRTLRKWLNRGDRLTAPMGDLQFSHILVDNDNDEVAFVDLSRFRWGEARGFDLGWLLCESIWERMRTGNKRISQIARFFLKTYEQISCDSELRKAILIGLSIKALVLLQIHGQQRRKLEPVDVRSRMPKKVASAFYKKIVHMLTIQRLSLG